MLSMPAASPAWIVRCAPAPVEQRDRRRDAVRREADLRAGQVEPDDAGVAVADDQPGHLVPAVVLPHGAQQRADPDRGAGLGGLRGRPSAKPSTIASTTASIGSPCAVDSSGAKRTSAYTTPSAARSSAHSRATRWIASGCCITPTVCAKVSRYRTSEPESAAWRNQCPRLSASSAGSAAVAELVGQLEHRLRAQAAVQVVVQQDLGGAADGLGGQRGRHAAKRSSAGAAVLPAEGARRTAPARRRTRCPAPGPPGPSSQEPAGSCAASASGRNTDRRPCAIHFSGKSDGDRLHPGRHLAELEEDAGDELQHAARSG